MWWKKSPKDKALDDLLQKVRETSLADPKIWNAIAEEHARIKMQFQQGATEDDRYREIEVILRNATG